MDWFYPKTGKRKDPRGKQGWIGQTVAIVSPPSLHLLLIFGIVIGLLCLSHYTDYKAQPNHTAINFQYLFFLLSPILVILLFMIPYSTSRRLNFGLTRSQHESFQRAGMSPWNVAILLLLMLLLLFYQSSSHSKWFGPLWRSD